MGKDHVVGWCACRLAAAEGPMKLAGAAKMNIAVIRRQISLDRKRRN
jgi:hypothetical protein